MAGPWEKFQTAAPQAEAPTAGPWSKFATQSTPAAVPAQSADIDSLITAKAQKYNLDPRMFRAQIQAESAFNPKAKSPVGAMGLGQLMPGTAADMGVKDAFDPEQNLEGSAKYMRQMLDRNGGNWEKALASYNWGPGNTAKNGFNNLPKETRDYVAKVMANSGDLDVPIPGADAPQYRAEPAQVPQGSTGNSGVDAGLRTAASFQRGMMKDPFNAGGQLLGMILPDKLERMLDFEDKTIIERQLQEEQAFEAERAARGGEGFDPARLAGNVANPANMALGMRGQGATSALAKIYQKLSPKGQAVIGAALRGGAAAAMQPVNTADSDQLITEKARQVGLGAAFGPLAEGAGRLVASGVGRAVGAARNELTPGVSAQLQEAQDAGIRLSAGDIRPDNKMIGGIEGTLENARIPGLSMSGFRKEQQQAAQRVAQSLVDDEYKAMQNMTFMSADRIRELAAGNSIRSAEARKVVQMMDDAGTDEKAIMQASGNMAWLRKKLSADKLYNEVERLAGDAPVPPNATLTAINQAIDDMGRVVDVDPTSVRLLNNWRDRLTAGADEGADGIETAVRQFEGAPADAGVPINSYAGMRQFRSDVRKRLDAATTNETTDASKLFLKRISTAIEQDMDDFANSSPGLKAANERANKFYRDNVMPYQKKKLATALTSDDPDQIYGAFVRAQAEGRGDYAAQNFFKALDNKGRQAVRYGIVNQALRNSLDGDEFSPAKFRSALQNTEYKQYFRGPEAARVDGVINLFGHLKRASPEHLQRYQAMLGGTLGMGGLVTGSVGGAIATGNVAPIAAAAGGASFMRWLMTSDAGKRLMFSSNVLAKGGSKEQVGKFLDNVAREYNSAAGATAGAVEGR